MGSTDDFEDDFEDDVTEVASKDPDGSAPFSVWVPTTTQVQSRSLRDRVPEARERWEPPRRPRSPEFGPEAQTVSPVRRTSLRVLLLVLLVALLAWVVFARGDSTNDAVDEAALAVAPVAEHVNAG